ncbi:helix-turn-helix domain-containing protein [Roseomonas sp. F4]|jgi:transcriptional regulator with XRE-family HTH domain|uniref:Helix-turn-helix transcriptional regulator n=2 Tax=Falsiroseomonas TaxID=2870713 RepID=A0ABS6HEM4_9PROT|nr:helix-turn-helix transcriptional regulator [Roseomonas oleicola]MBU8547185.1 helix-turn-helix transcriptional regulator [Roseomonas oleicola]NKE45304.1 helix-turn-helix transcriptional regulator [Falsiroseomonas frigidaquae]
MDMRRLVGRNVRRIRLEKGLTQEAFAERSGFSQQYLSDLERGRRNPTVVTLFELATALGVSHVALVEPDGEDARVTPLRRGGQRKESADKALARNAGGASKATMS